MRNGCMYLSKVGRPRTNFRAHNKANTIVGIEPVANLKQVPDPVKAYFTLPKEFFDSLYSCLVFALQPVHEGIHPSTAVASHPNDLSLLHYRRPIENWILGYNSQESADLFIP